jgi:hypothetical protein
MGNEKRPRVRKSTWTRSRRHGVLPPSMLTVCQEGGWAFFIQVDYF